MEHFGLCFQMPTVKLFWHLLALTLNLEIIGHTQIIIEYYWNEVFIVFVDSSKLIRTFTDKYIYTDKGGWSRSRAVFYKSKILQPWLVVLNGK